MAVFLFVPRSFSSPWPPGIKEKGVSSLDSNAIPWNIRDSIEMTKSILPERVVDLDCELDSFISNEKCTRKNMESLMGKLFFVSSCVASSRIFTFRLMAFLRTFPNRKIRLPILSAAKQDARWWRKFIHEWNGVSLILDKSWSNIDEVVASDASLAAGGAYTDKFYFSEEFPKNLADLPIHMLEF